MNIAVFGDSFADRNLDQSWWNLLQHRHGHTIRSFGQEASSLFYSARILDIYADQFDLVIWALTESDRASVIVDRGFLHLGPGGCKSTDPGLDLAIKDRIHDTYHQYLKYIFDRREADFVATQTVQNLMHRHGNLMVIPCFPNPLHTDFCLYEISERESQHYLGIKDLAKVCSQYQDLRQGHLVPRNHEILCDLVQAKLGPGVFQADLAAFVTEDGPRHLHFRPR